MGAYSNVYCIYFRISRREILRNLGENYPILRLDGVISIFPRKDKVFFVRIYTTVGNMACGLCGFFWPKRDCNCTISFESSGLADQLDRLGGRLADSVIGKWSITVLSLSETDWSTLIGRELPKWWLRQQCYAIKNQLWHPNLKYPIIGGYFACSLLVVYGIRIVDFHARKGSE